MTTHIPPTKRRTQFEAVYAELQKQAAPKAAPGEPMIEVTKQDANNYCLILRELGMEEEGDPVAEVRRLAAAPQQEAQEPVVAAVFDEQLGRPVLVEGAPLLRHGQELYTAPKPAPAPLSEQAEEAAMYRWLRAQHEDDSEGPRCCVYAPNDMRECLVPVGDMPGELDAFIRAALTAQGGK